MRKFDESANEYRTDDNGDGDYLLPANQPTVKLEDAMAAMDDLVGAIHKLLLSNKNENRRHAFKMLEKASPLLNAYFS